MQARIRGRPPPNLCSQPAAPPGVGRRGRRRGGELPRGRRVAGDEGERRGGPFLADETRAARAREPNRDGADDALWAETKGRWLPVHNASHNQHEDACRRLVRAMLRPKRRVSDRAGENATVLEASRWPRPRKCNTSLLERVLPEEDSSAAFLA